MKIRNILLVSATLFVTACGTAEEERSSTRTTSDAAVEDAATGDDSGLALRSRCTGDVLTFQTKINNTTSKQARFTMSLDSRRLVTDLLPPNFTREVAQFSFTRSYWENARELLVTASDDSGRPLRAYVDYGTNCLVYIVATITEPLPLPPPPPPSPTCGFLVSGKVLFTGQSIRSCDNKFTLILQNDGNFVEYGPNGAIWSSATGPVNQAGPLVGYGGTGNVVYMQPDGNLVLYKNGVATWSTKTYGFPGAKLQINGDSNLAIVSGTTTLWSWRTGNLLGR